MLELKILPYPYKEIKKFSSIEKIVDFPKIDLPPTTKIAPVSSAHGRIKALIFALPKDQKAYTEYNLLPVLKEIIKEMTDNIDEFIIIHMGQKLVYKNFQKEDKVHLLKTKNSDDDFNIWIQDYFYPLKIQKNKQECIWWAIGTNDTKHTTTLIHLNPSHTSSTLLKKVKIKTTGLPFEGGNILVGEDFFLVGTRDHHHDYKTWFSSEPIFIGTNTPYEFSDFDFFQKFKDGFQNILPPRKYTKSSAEYTIKQPLLHIDMFITLAGYNEKKTEYTIVVGKPQISHQVRKNLISDPKLLSALDRWLEQIKTAIHMCIEKFKKDFLKKKNKSIKVVDIPLILTYKDIVNCEKKQREWFWASYNNCLVEIVEKTTHSKEIKKVWLPSYGISSDYSSIRMSCKKQKSVTNRLGSPPDQLIKYGNWSNLKEYDDAAAATWDSIGFKVHSFKESYIPFACRQSSLNCITNVIDRS